MVRKESLLLAKMNIGDHGILNLHVLEGMADWVRVVDKDGNIIFANTAMKNALGESIVGMKCYHSHSRTAKCNFCISSTSITTGEIMQKEEIIDGRYYSVKSSPIKDNEGKNIAAVEVFRDVTRERKLELELIDKNKKMSKDLKFAKRIQERILPKKGLIENIRIDHIYQASEVLSGDMFDVFSIDEDNIGVYISDVAGHGIAASIMTMFIRQTMRAIKDDILSPSIVLTELHRRFSLLNLEPDKYFTMFYGVYNKTTHQFKYSNAGHNCIPIKYNSDGLELLKIKGYPIAMLFDELLYDEKRVELAIGDKVLLYTDGITEAKDYNGNEFGVEGVIETINNNPSNPLKDLKNKIKRHNWGEQMDDFAILLMEVMY